MSTLKADTIQNTSGGAATLTKQHAAKMWARLDGTGTIALDDSCNESRTTDYGPGNYAFIFTNNMSNANYNVAHASGNQIQIHSGANTSNVTILCRDQNNSNEDVDPAFSNIHGDLA